MDYLFQNWITLSLILSYLVLCLAIGWYFKLRASRGVGEYFIAKREIPGWVVSLAFFSTFASTNTYIGQAGSAFAAGLSWAWVGVFWTILCIVSWLLMGPRLRNQTAVLRSVTIPDYLDFRYQSSLSRPLRMLSAFVILFATVWYMAGIAKGCAHLLTSLLQVPHAWGALLILGVTTAYTIWGGMYSVLWTDAVQGLLMFGVAILMVTLPFAYVGGVDTLVDAVVYTNHPDASGEPIGSGLVTFCSLVSFAYILGIGLAVGMKQIAEPRCLIRFYSIDNEKGMKFAMIWTPIFLGVSLVCVMGLGALVHAMATNEEAAYLIQHTDEVVGFMLAKFDNQLIAGICLAGLIAAGMSSLASVILIAGTAFVSDILHVWKPLNSSRIIAGTKLTMMTYCSLVFLVTIYPPAGIVELTAFAGAIFAASFFPSIFGGLYLRWGTGHAAFASMLVGIFSCLLWRLAFRFQLPGMENIHEILPSVFISCVTYLLVSKWTSGRLPQPEHIDRIFEDAAGN